jgi:hypothetical protein
MTDPKTLEAVRHAVSWLRENKGKLPRDKLKDMLRWLKKCSKSIPEAESDKLRQLVCEAFSVSEEEVLGLSQGPAPPHSLVDDFLPLIPKKGWLRSYYEYVEDTEAPSAFHTMAAITIISAGLKRNVWVDFGKWKIYPNLATFLIGPSTWTHKTTAINIAVNLGLKANAFRLLAEKATSEYIIDTLAEGDEAVGFISMPELAASLTRKKYQEDLIQLLTRLWDCPDILPTGTIGRGGKDLVNVCVTTIAGSTEAWLVEAIPGNAFSGGFMARVLQIYQESGYKEVPRPSIPAPGIVENLIDKLSQIAWIKGVITLPAGSNKWFDEWYHEVRKLRPEDSRLDPFYGRMPDHVLRLATILRIAENEFSDRPDEAPVHLMPVHMEQAWAIMQWIMKYLPRVYASLGVAQVGVDADRILRFLKQKGGRATRPQVIRHMRGFVTGAQLDERLRFLEAGGEIEPVHDGVWTGYKLT